MAADQQSLQAVLQAETVQNIPDGEAVSKGGINGKAIGTFPVSAVPMI